MENGISHACWLILGSLALREMRCDVIVMRFELIAMRNSGCAFRNEGLIFECFDHDRGIQWKVARRKRHSSAVTFLFRLGLEKRFSK